MIAADNVVFITYPGHTLATAASINHFRQHYQFNLPITVIYDDIDSRYTSSYLEFIVKTYPNCLFVSASCFDVKGIRTGWIRQQLIKLSLDQRLDGDSWLCIDGDTFVYSDISYRHTPYRPAFYDNEGTDRAFRQYVNNCGLRYFDRADWGIDIRTNSLPVRFLTANLLRAVRNHVAEHCQMDFFDLHRRWFGATRDVINQTGRLMTEFELIENFRRCILGEESVIVLYEIRKFGARWQPVKPTVATFWGTDQDIADRYFLQNGITPGQLQQAQILRS